jgi:phage-related protein
MGIVTESKLLKPKPLIWMGSTKNALRALPADVMDIFGYALFLAQVGKRHESSKMLRGFGDASVLELIQSRARNTYRAVYTIRFEAAVFVLHVFQKKSTSGGKTPKRDMDLIVDRLKRAAEIATGQKLVKSGHKS